MCPLCYLWAWHWPVNLFRCLSRMSLFRLGCPNWLDFYWLELCDSFFAVVSTEQQNFPSRHLKPGDLGWNPGHCYAPLRQSLRYNLPLSRRRKKNRLAGSNTCAQCHRRRRSTKVAQLAFTSKDALTRRKVSKPQSRCTQMY